MIDNQSAYRRILKTTSLFGGLQLIVIIISVIKSKYVAMYLGPSGIGTISLFTNTIGLVASFTNFGLGTSAVKAISHAYGEGNNDKIAKVVGVVKKLVWITGLGGILLMLLTANWLSEITFKSSEYVIAFYWLSLTLLIQQLGIGYMVTLQGLQKLKLLAKSSLFGSIFGLIFSLPIYYFFHNAGIVPVFILSSLTSLFLSYYFSKNIKIEKVELSLQDVFKEGKSILILGFLIGLTAILDYIISYVTLTYIRRNGDVNAVGLYSAGFNIINVYVGMIFSAMLTDYYPKLSSVSNNTNKFNELVNQQAEIAILILAPIIILFIGSIKFIIYVLYTNEFVSMYQMMYWGMLGVLFKSLNWAVGIIVLAKGDSKKYFIIYLIAAIIVLSSNLLGYHYFGLEGLGIAFLISNIMLTIMGYFVARHFYSFKFNIEIIKIFILQLLFCICVFFVVQVLNGFLLYILISLLFLLSFFYSYKELNRRLDLIGVFMEIKQKIAFKNSSR